MTPEQQRIIIVAKAKAKARAAKQTGGGQMMRHFNQGVADFADFLNPFDTDHALNPFGRAMGSQQAADALGIELGGEAETAWQAAQQGAGQAAAGLIPVAKGLQALSKSGGAVGQFADDAYQALARYMGAGTEVAAGAASEAGQKGAENAGAPQWVQDTAAIAAPMSLAAVTPTAKLVGKAALSVGRRLPLSGPVVRAAEQLPGKVAAAAAPYTNTGARRVASERARELAGGKDRAEELAALARGDNPLNLTPAEMTNDPGMLAWQQEAASQDPALAARLANRAEQSTRTARSMMDEGGNVSDAQSFLGDRLRKYKVDMEARAERALNRTEQGIRSVGTNSMEPGDNSAALMREVDEAFRVAKAEETRLWDMVPKDDVVGVSDARAAAQTWQRELGQTRAHDIPQGVKRFLLDDNDAITDTATVRELHGLYSDLRQAARNARAGTNTNPTMAKVADDVADAILKDLGAADEAGAAITKAREASRQIHETFDQGAIGRLLRKTNAGDTATDPELALERTIGRGGTQAKVADEQFTAAVGDKSRPFVADYLKGTFGEKAFNNSGEFTRAGANGFIRNNQELLRRYPELRRDISEAVGERLGAEDFAERIGKAVDASQKARYNAAARFIDAAPEKAFDAILQDKSPSRAAAKIVAQARKDESGRALAGVKNAVSRRLIDTGFTTKAGRLTGDGDALVNVLDDPKMVSALRQIYEPSELNRLKMVGRHLAQLQNSRRGQAEIGDLVEPRAGRLIETLGRIAGARMGAQVSGGGAGPSLQAAQIGSSRVKEALGYLVSDKASQMMADAVEDPQLFSALLTEVAAPRIEKVLPRLVPYLVGTGITSE